MVLFFQNFDKNLDFGVLFFQKISPALRAGFYFHFFLLKIPLFSLVKLQKPEKVQKKNSRSARGFIFSFSKFQLGVLSGLFTRYDPPPFESKSQQNKGGGVISSSILILRIRMILRAPQARKFARICSFSKQNPLRKRYIPLKFSRLRRAHQLRHRTKSQMYNSFSRSEIIPIFF
mgnify:CR=1 FL=1